MASRVSPWSGDFQTRADLDGAVRGDKGSARRDREEHISPFPSPTLAPDGHVGPALWSTRQVRCCVGLHGATKGWWQLPTGQSWSCICERGTCHMCQLKGAGAHHCSSPGRSSTETRSGTDYIEHHALRLLPGRVRLHGPLHGMEAPQTAWVSLASMGLGSFLNFGIRSWPLGR